MTLAVAVLGASGAMGQRVLARIAQDPTLRLAATLVRPGSAVDAQRQGDGVSRAVGPGCVAGCDVVIDFSAPAALIDAAPHLTGVALVSGTTGLDERARAALADLGRTAPVLHAANFSVGVHLLLDLVARAAAAMPDADVEVVEIHHRRKRDAPSGTALALGAAAQRARSVLEPVHGRLTRRAASSMHRARARAWPRCANGCRRGPSTR